MAVKRQRGELCRYSKKYGVFSLTAIVCSGLDPTGRVVKVFENGVEKCTFSGEVMLSYTIGLGVESIKEHLPDFLDAYAKQYLGDS